LNSCSRIPLIQPTARPEIGTPYFQLFCRSMSTCNVQTLTAYRNCHQSVYRCLIRCCHVRIRTAKCFANSSEQHRWAVRFENVLLMKKRCSHLHSFCATVLSIGLATKATLIRVPKGRLGESVRRD
jgi:hypothetical protein